MELLQQLQKCSWKEFEKLISEVLELHNYTTYWNVNVTINGVRRQFDVIANRNNYSLIIDCKKWCNKKSKASALRNAVIKHKKRCDFYGQLLQKKVIPLIVTYAEDDIKVHDGVCIVPLQMLNNFILELL
ncbi:MAG: restriction endonuclease [Nanoarchaeota archaeon]|nr:restriction endonuclease [Nanoarchaeota archaeon]